jgi:hypothetical protein
VSSVAFATFAEAARALGWLQPAAPAQGPPGGGNADAGREASDAALLGPSECAAHCLYWHACGHMHAGCFGACLQKLDKVHRMRTGGAAAARLPWAAAHSSCLATAAQAQRCGPRMRRLLVRREAPHPGPPPHQPTGAAAAAAAAAEGLMHTSPPRQLRGAASPQQSTKRRSRSSRRRQRPSAAAGPMAEYLPAQSCAQRRTQILEPLHGAIDSECSDQGGTRQRAAGTGHPTGPCSGCRGCRGAHFYSLHT